MVWIDHLAYAPSGQLYNVASEEIAAAVAIAMHADKLILLGEEACLRNQEHVRISELTLSDIADVEPQQSTDLKLRLAAAERAVRGGVPRCHLLSATSDGAILTELLTTEGSGTLLTQEPTATIRPAQTDDLASLLHLLAPLESSGALVQRSREKLEAEIAHFHVVEQDSRLLGSAALYPLDAQSAELACLAVEPEQGGETLGTRLLHAIESRARAEGITTLFVLTTQAQDWFIERGFSETSVDALPENRQSLYNFQRNSAVLVKTI
jgi:amino-acid N-acetyltransferase